MKYGWVMFDVLCSSLVCNVCCMWCVGRNGSSRSLQVPKTCHHTRCTEWQHIRSISDCCPRFRSQESVWSKASCSTPRLYRAISANASKLPTLYQLDSKFHVLSIILIAVAGASEASGIPTCGLLFDTVTFETEPSAIHRAAEILNKLIFILWWHDCVKPILTRFKHGFRMVIVCRPYMRM
jgi:hypothetical protein